MKCDELKSLKNIGLSFDTTTLHKQVIAEDSEGKCYGFDSWEEIYLKSDVDAAIAELKRKLQGQCISCPVKMQEDDVVAELKAENENLKNNLFVVETDIAMAARWRKVSEELPQNGQDVWAYDSRSKSILLLEYEKSDEGEGFIVFPYKHDFLQNITQWMPFEKPKAPEETEK